MLKIKRLKQLLMKATLNKTNEHILNKLLKHKVELESTDSVHVYQITKTKHDEPVLLKIPHSKYIHESVLIVNLLSIVQGKICEAQINLVFNGTTMNIGDILFFGTNTFTRGYGTILLDTSLSIARTRNVKTVTGIMVYIDSAQRTRQLGFYKNFGFSTDSNILHLELN